MTCSCGHDNPLCECHVDDAERAELLEQFIEVWVDEFGKKPLLMPLDSEGKVPAIAGQTRLDNDRSRSLLVEADEAVRQLRAGARGFAIYAGKETHNTEDAVFIDVDHKPTFPFDAFPDTLRSLSGSGRGPHLTYRNDADDPVSNARGSGDVDGEVRAHNWYVIVPGSVHPSGGIYHVTEDHAGIATLSREMVPDALLPGTERAEAAVETAPATNVSGTGDVPDDADVRDAMQRMFDNPWNGDELQNIYHGNYAAAGWDDRSSAEFKLVNAIDSWVAFGDEAVVRQVMGDSNCEKWHEGGETYRKPTLKAVGHQDRYFNDDIVENDTDTHLIDDRREYAGIDEADIPTDVNVLLSKPPREGGSFALMRHALERDGPTIIAASRHSILEAHLETLVTELVTDETVVWYEGSGRVCDNPGGGQCPKWPEDHDDIREIQWTIRDHFYEEGVLTADDVTSNVGFSRWCTAAVLKQAALVADVVLTVPQLLPNIDEERDLSDVTMVIDEEQAIDHFLPPSVELLSIGTNVDASGRMSVVQTSFPLSRELDALDAVRDEIDARQKIRKAGDGGFRRNSYEIDIINAIQYLEELAEALSIIDANRATDGGTTADVRDQLMSSVSALERPDPRCDPDQLRSNIQELTAQFYHTDIVDPAALIEAVLFSSDAHPFHWKFTGTAWTLRLIGDREATVFHRELLNSVRQLALIAGPEGEIVLDHLDAESCVIDITSFRFSDDFIVIPVDTHTNAPTTLARQRDVVRRTSHELNRRHVPHITIHGTREQATSAAGSYDGAAQMVSAPETPHVDLWHIFNDGAVACIYENSVVSRGIDVPFFDVCCIVDPGFAAPYWEAKVEHHETTDVDAWRHAVAVEREVKRRELTNAAFRMAPTRTTRELTGTKFIIVSELDRGSIDYLDAREVPTQWDPSAIGELLDVLVAHGDKRKADDHMHDQLGGGRAFSRAVLEAGTDGGFVDSAFETRPRYHLPELRSWLDDDRRHLTTNNLDAVIEAIKRSDGTTRDIRDNAPGVHTQSVQAILTALQGRGIVDKKETTLVDSGGTTYKFSLTDVTK